MSTMNPQPMGTDPEEFFSLPPVLKRKLFSNVERFQFEQSRLQDESLPLPASASSSPAPPFLSPSSPRSSAPLPSDRQRDTCSSSIITSSSNHHTSWPRPSRIGSSGTSGTSDSCRPFKRAKEKKTCQFPRVRRKAPPEAVNPAATHHHVVRGKFIDVQDLQTFLSLSPKVQKQLFAPEERAFFAWWSSNIFEAAATSEPYQEPQSPLTKELSNMDKEFALHQEMLNAAQPGDRAGAEIVDDKFINCLDAHDIDLTLDDYTDDVSEVYSHEVKSTPQSPRRSQFTRAGSSLCRQWAIRPVDGYDENDDEEKEDDWEAHSSRSPITPSTPELSDPGHEVSQHTITTPKEDDGKKACHWQDPEARWRLKVFLSDPQKFDEAVQHGFPAEVSTYSSSINSNSSSHSNNSSRNSSSHDISKNMHDQSTPPTPSCLPHPPQSRTSLHRVSSSLCMTPTSTTTTTNACGGSGPHIFHARSRTLSKSRGSMQSSIHRFEHPPRPASSGANPLTTCALTSRRSTRFSLDQRLRRRPSEIGWGVSHNATTSVPPPPPAAPSAACAGACAGAGAGGGEAGRLMTIKMTLTPSDLRDEDPVVAAPESERAHALGSSEKPTMGLRDRSLSILDERHPIWEDLPPAADDGRLKRMWRRLKKSREVKTW